MDSPANESYKKSVALYRDGKYSEALQILRDLDARFPDQADLLYGMARIRKELHHTDDVRRIAARLRDQFHDPRGEQLLKSIDEEASERAKEIDVELFAKRPQVTGTKVSSHSPLNSFALTSPEGTVPDWVAMTIGWLVIDLIVFLVALLAEGPRTAIVVVSGRLLPAPLVALALYFLGKSLLGQLEANPMLGCIYGLGGILLPLLMTATAAVLVLFPIAIGALVLRPMRLGLRETKLTAKKKTEPYEMVFGALLFFAWLIAVLAISGILTLTGLETIPNEDTTPSHATALSTKEPFRDQRAIDARKRLRAPYMSTIQELDVGQDYSVSQATTLYEALSSHSRQLARIPVGGVFRFESRHLGSNDGWGPDDGYWYGIRYRDSTGTELIGYIKAEQRGMEFTKVDNVEEGK